MPLLPGKSNIGKNIKTEQSAGKPHAQAVAIALHTAGVPKKNTSESAESCGGKPMSDHMQRFTEKLKECSGQ